MSNSYPPAELFKMSDYKFHTVIFTDGSKVEFVANGMTEARAHAYKMAIVDNKLVYTVRETDNDKECKCLSKSAPRHRKASRTFARIVVLCLSLTCLILGTILIQISGTA